MKRNFKKRFRGLFLTVSLAACGCGNIESISSKNLVGILALSVPMCLLLDNLSEKEIKKRVECEIDKQLKEYLGKLDEDEHKNNQKEKKERVYEKVAQILKNYLAEVAECNGSYKRLVWKLLSHYSKIKKFQNMENKNLGTANIIWCVLSLKYYKEFDSEKAKKDEKIQEDLENIVNNVIDIVFGAICKKLPDMIANLHLENNSKKFIRAYASKHGDWIDATSSFLELINDIQDIQKQWSERLPGSLVVKNPDAFFAKIEKIRKTLSDIGIIGNVFGNIFGNIGNFFGNW